MAAAGIYAADAHEPLLHQLAPRNNPAGGARPQKWDEVSAGARFRSEHAREQRDNFLKARAGALVFIKSVGGPAPLADEDDLGRRLQVGELGVWVIDVPDDLGRRPVEPDQIEQRTEISLRLRGLAAAERSTRRHFGQFGRHIRTIGRERIEQEQGRSPFLM